MIDEVGDVKSTAATDRDRKRPKCNVCDYSSNNSNNLKTHKLIHSRIKLYTCDVCGGVK